MADQPKQAVVITDGEYEDYGITAILRGDPDALDRLWAAFAAEFRVPNRNHPEYISGRGDYYADEQAAEEAALAAGYGSDASYERLAASFVDWLIKRHSWERLDVPEFRVRRSW